MKYKYNISCDESRWNNSHDLFMRFNNSYDWYCVLSSHLKNRGEDIIFHMIFFCLKIRYLFDEPRRIYNILGEFLANGQKLLV